MIQLREEARFAEEAKLGEGAQPVLRPNGLQRDATLKRVVEAGVDLSHSPFTQGMEHAVVRDGGSHQLRCV
jgi:hypothetical protein